MEYQENLFFVKALEIGYDLCKEAVWHGERCTWIDFTTSQQGIAPKKKYYINLGPNFYEGTAGIAFFLDRLYQATGDKIFLRTAKAALNRSIEAIGQTDYAYRYGFYTGLAGVWFVSLKGSIELTTGRIDQWLKESQATLLVNGDNLENIGTDIINGAAGLIKTLILTYDRTNNISFLEIAIRTGDQLIANAKSEAQGLSWTTLYSADYNLTGYAHGAAGIACAFADLYRATGNGVYLTTAVEAVAYEESLFNPARNNWPDLRKRTGKGKEATANYPYANAWCHGAPGILLSRLNLSSSVGDLKLTDAISGAATTITAAFSEKKYDNLSLCHGLCGNGQILQIAGHALKQSAYSDLADEMGYSAIDTQKRLGFWPSGLDAEREVLGFMNGKAGMGNFLLNLYLGDPAGNGLYI